MGEVNYELPENFNIGYLFQSSIQKNWNELIGVYQNNPLAWKAKLTTSEDTALHIVVSLDYADERDAIEHAKLVSQLVDSLPSDQAVEILGLKNDKGNIPLHLAAAGGGVLICQYIASKDHQLIKDRNLKGETPLFLAAQHGKIEAFLCLNQIFIRNEEDGYALCRRNSDGDTILHSAIAGEYFELAYQIIKYYPRLICAVNQEGLSPLHILARNPSVFASSCNLPLFERMIYRCVIVSELKKYIFVEQYEIRELRSRDSSKNTYPDIYETCLNFIHLLYAAIASLCCFVKQISLSCVIKQISLCCTRKETGSDKENITYVTRSRKLMRPETEDEGSCPPIYDTCIRFYELVNILLFKLGIGSKKAIREMKKRHKWAVQIMNELIEHASVYMYSHNGEKPSKNVEPMYPGRSVPPSMPPGEHDTHSIEGKTISGCKPKDKEEKDGNRPVAKSKDAKETPILVAAKMGINEMVEKIIKSFPVAIQDVDANGKNALLLTAEYRQPKVFDSLMKMNLPGFLLHQVDNEGNSALHLAAMFEQHQPQPIPGVALLMQWEIKWYEHVKNSIPPQSLIPHNAKGETADEIFTTTHEKLMKQESDRLMKTSESCSVVAALIASVAYATSSTVPGGFNQTTGYPLFQDQPTFHLYSVTSLLALCFSVTALVFFLAILTSRSQQKDFKNDLPRKLLFGLISLLTSITAMLVSFCAGHFFVLKNQLPKQALPTYVIACLPLACFTIAKLPVYLDLTWSMLTRVPLHSYKVFNIYK